MKGTLARWACLSAAGFVLITGCHHQVKPVAASQLDTDCFSTCVAEMSQCHLACKAANEECMGNARYVAAIKVLSLKRYRINATATIKDVINTKPCQTDCGCIKSRSMCQQLCLGKATAPVQ